MDNSPHVLLFAPLIRELQSRGVTMVLTVRDFSQTKGLAEQFGLDFTTIGRHHQSRSLFVKATGTLQRAWQARQFIRRAGITAAISHGSRALVLASYSLGIPVMTLYDYEFASYRLFNMFSARLLAPWIIPEERLVSQGLDLKKLVRYPGLKEEVYVYSFQPDASLLQKLEVDPAKVIVTLRPPATWAHYHNQHSEVMFQALIDRLKAEPEVVVVIPARTAGQEADLRQRFGLTGDKFRIFTNPVDGLSLMWFSDLVFSGGGTMTREAALLGLNVYSIFGGEIGAGDEFLIREGRLRLLRDPAEIASLPWVKRKGRRAPEPRHPNLAAFLADEIVQFSTEFRKA